MQRGLRPPRLAAELGFCSHQWAYPAHTRGSFRFTTKGTKGVPGAAAPGPCLGALSSPSNAVAPPRKLRHHMQLKYHRGCRNLYTPATNTAKAETGGIQEGPPPCVGGQTKRSLVSPWQHLCGYFQRHPGRSALLLGERRGAPLAHPPTPVGKKRRR